jgi:hypothetical protein
MKATPIRAQKISNSIRGVMKKAQLAMKATPIRAQKISNSIRLAIRARYNHTHLVGAAMWSNWLSPPDTKAVLFTGPGL